MKLSTFSDSRDNNFNLIRILAAIAVLITHSFALYYGSSDSEPLRNIIGMTPGMIAVDVFFVISGFLVTRSLLNNDNFFQYSWSRLLRIYPALIVMLILITIFLGLLFSNYNFYDYITDKQTVKFLVKNSLLVFGIDYNLPGVFKENPMNEVNGSLWTMRHEIRLYIVLAFVWVIFKRLKHFRLEAFKPFIVMLGIVSYCAFLLTGLDFLRLFYMFFVGSSLYLYRDYVPVNKLYFAVTSIVLLLFLFTPIYFFFAYSVLLPYLVLCLAYIPGGYIRKYNNVGDYSYGVYIYAWPVTQALILHLPGANIYTIILFVISITFPLAMLSWNIIESKALQLKKIDLLNISPVRFFLTRYD